MICVALQLVLSVRTTIAEVRRLHVDKSTPVRQSAKWRVIVNMSNNHNVVYFFLDGLRVQTVAYLEGETLIL